MITLLLFALQAFAANDVGFVHHPEPKDPVFVSAQIYDDVKKKLPAQPTKGSEAQKKDESELRRYQKVRTEAECARAKSEVLVSLESFFGTPNGPLHKEEVAKLDSFFQQVRNDADYFIQRLKKDFPRQRPFLYVTGLEPCVAKEVTGAYPSGHAALSKLYAMILSDLYPKRAKEFAARADIIAEDRILSGMHHPSDIEAGRKLAIQLYGQFEHSEKFRSALTQLKTK